MLQQTSLNHDRDLPWILGKTDGDPYPIYAALQSRASVLSDVFSTCTWLVTTHAEVDAVLRDAGRNYQTQPPGGGYVCARHAVHQRDGDDHKRLRSAILPLVSRVSTDAFRESVRKDARELVEPYASMQRFSLSGVALALPVRTICRLLGIPREDAGAWAADCAAAASLIADPRLSDTQRGALAGEAKYFTQRVRCFVEDVERLAPAEHPVRTLLAYETAGMISRSELIDNLLFLFIAAFATTARAIGNVVAGMLQQDHWWHTCIEDRRRLQQVVKEWMRFDGVAHGVVRYARCDTQLGGQYIRRGDRLLLLLAAANRDPREFVCPEAIRPDREGARSMAFGAGMHVCVGRSLAMLEIEAVLLALFDKIPRLILDEQASKRCQNGLVHGYEEVWLHNPTFTCS